MDNSLKIEIIKRFDTFFSGINNKGAFLLAFNTFLIGAFLMGYNDFICSIKCDFKLAFNLMIGFLMLCSIVSMILTIVSMIPYLDSKETNGRKSNWFFNDIATEDKQAFFDRINSTSNTDNTNDLNNQIYELSKGLKKKHCFVKVALIFNLIQIILLIPIITLILI